MSHRLAQGLLFLICLTFTLAAHGQTVSFTDEEGIDTATYLEASKAYVRLEDPSANADPTLTDSASVTLSSNLGGDVESLVLTETGENTGIFTGSISLALTPSGQPGVLETDIDPGPPFARDTIQVDYQTGATVDSASLVGSRTVFLNELGQKTGTFTLGDRVYLRIEDHLFGDPQIIDQIIQVVDVPNTLDSQNVPLTETGFDTGIYEGSIAVFVATHPEPSSETLDANTGDAFEAVYVDAGYPNAFSRADATVGSSLVFILDHQGQPTEVVLESSSVTLRVIDPQANNEFAVDSTSLDLSAILTGDYESLLLTETGTNTRTFEATVELGLGTGASSNGVLDTTQSGGPPHQFDTIQASHFDMVDNPLTTATTLGSRTWFVDAFGEVIYKVAVGSTVYLRVEDHNADQSGLPDTVLVTVSAPSTGDIEDVQLTETGNSSGVFAGSLSLEDEILATSYDGQLQVTAVESISANHDDSLGYTSSTAQAWVVFSTVEFIDADGQPTSELLEAGTARVRVTSVNDNYDSNVPETFNYLTLESLHAGDFEPYTPLTETGPDTGIFEGSIPMALGTGQTYNSVLETSNSGAPEYGSDQVTARMDTYGSQKATATTVGSKIIFTDAAGEVIDAYAIGEEIHVRVEEPARNTLTLDVVNISLRSSVTGDNETLALTETAIDSGIFTGSIVSDSGAASFNDAILQVTPGELIEAENFNQSNPSSSLATAEIIATRLRLFDAAGQPTELYLQGETAHVWVFDRSANFNPSDVDYAYVDLRAVLTNDMESLSLVETGPDTNTFVGSITTSTQPPSSYNVVLELGEDTSPHRFDTVEASYYDPSGGSSASAETTGSRTWFVDGAGAVTSVYAVGSTAHVMVEDYNADQSPAVDVTSVDLSAAASGDIETLTLTETGGSTGVFTGVIALDNSSFGIAHDGMLQGVVAEQVSASHLNALGYSSSTAQANLSDGSLEFVDENGDPTSEVLRQGIARLRLFSAGANVDPNASDNVAVDIYTYYAGDSEQVVMTETGPDTNTFEGQIQLADGTSVYMNALLETLNSGSPTFEPEILTAQYGALQANATTTLAEVFLLDATGNERSSFVVGEGVYVRIIDHTKNFNSSQVETFGTSFDNVTNGDLVTYTVVETGPDTGIFEGSIQTSAAPFDAFDNLISAATGDVVRQIYFDTSVSFSTEASATMSGSGIEILNAAGVGVEEILKGSAVILRVIDSSANLTPSSVEVTSADFSSQLSGDLEVVSLTETGPDTGVFEGQIQLSSGSPSGNNGLLETSDDPQPPHVDTLTAQHFDASGSSIDTATTVGSLIWFIDAYGNITNSYATGTTVYVRVEDHNIAQPSVVDTVLINVQALDTGDSEQLLITETGRDTSIFEGFLALEDSSVGNPNNGRLQTMAGATIEVSHPDFSGYTVSVAQAAIDFASIRFIDENGQPTHQVLENGTARVRVTSVFDNFDSGTANTVDITLGSLYAGDNENLTLIETDVDTGVFEGQMQLQFGSGVPGNGFLETTNSDTPEFLPEQLIASFGVVSDTAQTIETHVSFIDLQGQEVTSYAVRSTVGIRVEALTRNDSGLIDTFGVSVRSLSSGDLETVQVVETDVDTGLFEGSVPSSESTSLAEDALLTATSGETLEVEVFNLNTPSSTTAQATIGTNFAPTVVDDTLVTVEGQAATLSPLANDSDPESQPLTISEVGQGANGSVMLNPDDSVTYTPNPSFAGSDSFAYLVADPEGGISQGSVSVTVTANTPPTVTINLPTAPTFIEGESVLFDGTASDIEDGDITANLAWRSDLDGAIGNGGSFSITTLSVGTHTITAQVDDAHGAQGTDTITVTINANTPPTVSITSPSNGAVFTSTDPVNFTGTANDVQDGDVTANLTWTSSLDGLIGSGGSFSISTLSQGTHTVTATVTDSHGAPGSDSITVTVNTNTPPTANITNPSNGAILTLTDPVNFTGTASDAQDGDLTANLTWTSSLDGLIGTGGSFSSSTLSLGTHVITAQAVDSHGDPGSDSISISIHPNTPPVVAITAPGDGDLFTVGDSIAFTATALDAENGDLSASLSWSSDLDGVIGAGGSFSTSALSIGVHTIIAAVTDSHGVNGADSLTIRVLTLPVQVTFTSIGAEDGWVRESNENSGVGGSVNTTGAGSRPIRIGDSNGDRQYKSILSFDTSSLPGGAVITDSTLRLRRGRLTGSNPFGFLGDALVDVQTGGFSGDTALTVGDFETPATATAVAILSDAPNNLDWSEGQLDADGRAALNANGTTQLRVYFAIDDDNDNKNDYMGYYSADTSNASRHPQLVVTYQQ